MKKLSCLLLSCLLLLGLMAACGKKQSTGIVGTWKATVPLAEYGNIEDIGPVADYLEEEDLVLGLILTFTGDGKFIMSVDSKSVDKLVDVLCDGIEAYIKDMAKALGLEVKDILGGMTVYEFAESNGQLADFKQLAKISSSGEYTYINSILTMNGNLTKSNLDGRTLTLELNGQSVTFKRK